MPDTQPTPLDLEDLRRTIAEVFCVDPGEVTDETRFVEDLGGDSLLALEVIVALEKKYAVRFAESDVRGLTTLPRTYDVLADKLGAQG
ncbi:acyl carrier protein [Streptomyces javensis]